MPADLRLTILLAVAAATGCGAQPELPGGTPGQLRIAGAPGADIEIAVYRVGSDGTVDPAPVAFGLTGAQGEFQLRTPGSLEAVKLTPGEYRFTLASAGGVYFEWPRAYRAPETTPLTVSWTDQMPRIELDAPSPTVESPRTR